LAAAAGIALLVLISGCSGDSLSLVYNVATMLIDALSTAATTAA
jgi:hypothetical protein